jgi:hypothetical protein
MESETKGNPAGRKPGPDRILARELGMDSPSRAAVRRLRASGGAERLAKMAPEARALMLKLAGCKNPMSACSLDL